MISFLTDSSVVMACVSVSHHSIGPKQSKFQKKSHGPRPSRSGYSHADLARTIVTTGSSHAKRLHSKMLQLAREYGFNMSLDYGLSGANSFRYHSRHNPKGLYGSILLDQACASNAEIAIIFMGGNDLDSPVGKRPQTSTDFYDNFMRVIREFRSHDIVPYVLGVPGRFRTRHIHVDNYKSFCRAVNKKLRENLGQYFIALPSTSYESNMYIDEIHFHEDHYEAIARQTLEYLTTHRL